MSIGTLIVFGILAGVLATRRGFNPLAWIFAASCIGLIVLFIMPSAKEDGISPVDREHRAKQGNMVGWILTGFGYVPNVEQTAHSLFGIRLFFGLIPAGFILLSLPLLIKYPIKRKSHAAVRAKLDAMDAAAKTESNEPA